jgi:hypothetical protein
MMTNMSRYSLVKNYAIEHLLDYLLIFPIGNSVLNRFCWVKYDWKEWGSSFSNLDVEVVHNKLIQVKSVKYVYNHEILSDKCRPYENFQTYFAPLSWH